MRFPGYKTAAQISKVIKSWVFPGAVILGYHRIASPQVDVFASSVSPENFYQQMEVLKRMADPQPMHGLVSKAQGGEGVAKIASVTFDDGYMDTLREAMPILEKFDIPGTVFVTTGYFGSEFWWDELERLILGSASRPDILRLTHGDLKQDVHLKNDKLQDRKEMTILLARFLRPLDEVTRENKLSKIRTWLDISSTPDRFNARSLNPEEISAMARHGLISIESHSVSHPPMGSLSADQQFSELTNSKSNLEKITEKPVRGFAYPYGSRSRTTMGLVREAGYSYACASTVNAVHKADLYDLPRIWPKDWDGDRFEREIRRWLGR
jgi:peptidoglycan/xylan/chitin deacetylase (PgdA/CDA1 family)